MSGKWNECRQNRKSLSLLVSGLLSDKERQELGRHLINCADCRAHYDQLKAVTTTLSHHKKSVPHIQPTDAMRTRWSREIHAASKDSTGRDFKPRSGWGNWWDELVRPYRFAWGGMAALWLVMWWMNWGLPELSSAGTRSSASPEMASTFADEQKMLAELFPPMESQPAEPPRQKPSPRSEQKQAWSMA